jgi:SAM-dependent methyltransferase
MIKCLATQKEQNKDTFRTHMEAINHVARQGALKEYTTYCRIWEYPWVWQQLKSISTDKQTVLDIGSERSPFGWFLATQGYDVIISDYNPAYRQQWRETAQKLNISVRKRILNAQALDLHTASVDIYLSVSVIEHIPDKSKVIAEAARVLRPGGWLIMTFDICEPDMGMTFPAWNGQALTMQAFDTLFQDTPWFEPGLDKIAWNTETIPDYLAWHRTTAPHHNYVAGGAMIRRNDRVWSEASWKDSWRQIRGPMRTAARITAWRIRRKLAPVKQKLVRIINQTR